MDVLFATSHGLYELCQSSFDTLEDILKKSGIPPNSVSIYGCRKGNNEGLLIAALKSSVADLSTRFTKVIVRPDRNIHYEAVALGDLNISPTENAVSEYTFISEEGQTITHKYFSEADCKEYVTGCVTQFLTHVEVDPTRPIVVGVSGGGDSNALLDGLIGSGKFQRSQIIPVMMMGIPDWDLGLERAKAQCARLGLDLQIVESQKVNELLGRSASSEGRVTDFESIYADSDLEVIGTLAVRLALSSVVRLSGAQAAITGLNMEDILAECVLATLRGEEPLPFPIRQLDNVTFRYPIYRCPKKIIDGCYPKLSLQNYGDRYPSYMYWRAAAYHLAQQIGSAQVGMEFNLLDEFETLSKNSKRKPAYNAKLGFSIPANVESRPLVKWKKFTSGDRRGTLQSIT
jgi:hypothetical protein